jgi:molybdopterin synthase catalytic subunit
MNIIKVSKLAEASIIVIHYYDEIGLSKDVVVVVVSGKDKPGTHLNL